MQKIFKFKAIKKPVKKSGNKDRDTVEGKNCPNCFINHFPLPKFCRWAKSSSVTPQNCNKGDQQLKFTLDETICEHINFLEMKQRNEWLYQQLPFG